MGIGASQDLCAVRAPAAAGVAAGRPGAEGRQRMSAAARALRSPRSRTHCRSTAAISRADCPPPPTTLIVAEVHS